MGSILHRSMGTMGHSLYRCTPGADRLACPGLHMCPENWRVCGLPTSLMLFLPLLRGMSPAGEWRAFVHLVTSLASTQLGLRVANRDGEGLATP